jgi:hypothetical protein
MHTTEEIENIIDNGHKDPFIEELSQYREAGRDINAIDEVGYTWLTRALISQHIYPYDGCTEERVRAVLAAGADPNLADATCLPLLYACGWQYGYGLGPTASLVRILLNAGADSTPRINIDIPSTFIDENGNIDCREDIIKNIDSLEAWLSDIEYNVDIIERCYPNMHASSIKTLRELAEIRRLFSSGNTNSE